MGLADAEKVIDWQITSSPYSTPHSISARCRAAVPADSAATLTSVPRKVSILRSKPSTLGPRGATQFASKASWIYFNSLPPIWGEDNQILDDIMLFAIKYNHRQ